MPLGRVAPTWTLEPDFPGGDPGFCAQSSVTLDKFLASVSVKGQHNGTSLLNYCEDEINSCASFRIVSLPCYILSKAVIVIILSAQGLLLLLKEPQVVCQCAWQVEEC